MSSRTHQQSLGMPSWDELSSRERNLCKCLGFFVVVAVGLAVAVAVLTVVFTKQIKELEASNTTTTTHDSNITTVATTETTDDANSTTIATTETTDDSNSTTIATTETTDDSNSTTIATTETTDDSNSTTNATTETTDTTHVAPTNTTTKTTTTSTTTTTTPANTKSTSTTTTKSASTYLENGKVARSQSKPKPDLDLNKLVQNSGEMHWSKGREGIHRSPMNKENFERFERMQISHPKWKTLFSKGRSDAGEQHRRA
ncbi:integumentary mucin C.1 [Hyalella azteca]|uniref:Integumentary mucin C.1 n=1 Tax=Hyalella azteca TaxID=294128 RepID=A0A8B7PCI7_HYAAZ|nr:integumentary mucin C.1 [Hyalella azteca]